MNEREGVVYNPLEIKMGKVCLPLFSPPLEIHPPEKKKPARHWFEVKHFFDIAK